MSCDVGKATEGLENELWCCFTYIIGTSSTSQLIPQPFHCFIYVTVHSTILLLLHLRHSYYPTLLPLHLRHNSSRATQNLPEGRGLKTPGLNEHLNRFGLKTSKFCTICNSPASMNKDHLLQCRNLIQTSKQEEISGGPTLGSKRINGLGQHPAIGQQQHSLLLYIPHGHCSVLCNISLDWTQFIFWY